MWQCGRRPTMIHLSLATSPRIGLFLFRMADSMVHLAVAIREVVVANDDSTATCPQKAAVQLPRDVVGPQLRDRQESRIFAVQTVYAAGVSRWRLWWSWYHFLASGRGRGWCRRKCCKAVLLRRINASIQKRLDSTVVVATNAINPLVVFAETQRSRSVCAIELFTLFRN